MSNEEQTTWLNQSIGSLFIGEEYYHHHAYEIINTHKTLKNDLLNSISSKIAISPRIKKTKQTESKGIKADDLNKQIRKLLNNKLKAEVKLEVSEEMGVFYFSSEKNTIGGFDFAILNHQKNLTSLRNLCFGELHYHEGQKRWNKFLAKNQDLKKIAKKLENTVPIGQDLIYNEHETDTPLIVGEIQFGNWALAYRDFFKVLKANVQNSIDCLIYIVESTPKTNVFQKFLDITE